MMAESFLKRTFSGYVPADDEAKEIHSHIPMDELVKADITRPRNANFHRYFFSLLRFISENSPGNPTTKSLLIFLKHRLGYYKTIKLKDGTLIFSYESISFAKMSEDDFRKFVTDAINVLTLEWLPQGTKSTDVEREYLERVGIPANSNSARRTA